MRRSLGAALLLALTSCGSDPRQPARLATGSVTCDFCHMTVETERRAAQYAPTSGRVRVFDEPGCLMRYIAMAAPGDPDGAIWVHDEASGDWMDARRAFFVIPASPVPGMMFGVLAYRDRDRAEEARGEGRIAAFHELLAELRA